MTSSTNMDEKQRKIKAIVKALGYAENGGKPNLNNLQAGKTGELKSIFQFTPDTWKNYAQQELGDANAELTPDNETFVVSKRVEKWIDEGKTARQIASIWNAGQGEPDAYTGKFSNGNPSVGINKKYGVKFDVPSYANKVLNYSKQFYEEGQSQPQQPQKSPETQKALQSVLSTVKNTQTKQPQPQVQQSPDTSKALKSVLSTIQNTSKKTQPAPSHPPNVQSPEQGVSANI